MKRKGFTLIELIVVMAIITILILIGYPKYKEYTNEAQLTRIKVNVKELEQASNKYYMTYNDWPRLSDTPYTAEQVEGFGERILAKTGKVVVLEENGNYYDIDYAKIKNYVNISDDGVNYILQNPVGSVFYIDGATEVRKKSVNKVPREERPLITWNPLDITNGSTLSDNNYTASLASTKAYGVLRSDLVRATEGKLEGKWYWEIYCDGNMNLNMMIGIAPKGTTAWSDTRIRAYRPNGVKIGGSSNYSIPYGDSYIAGDTIGIAMDLEENQITFYKNGVSQGVAFTNLSEIEYYPYAQILNTSYRLIATANFGANSFKYSVPDGYKPYDYANALWFN